MYDTTDALVREANHRCSNDLQMVLALVKLSAQRAACDATRDTLVEIANRVRLLADARTALLTTRSLDLETTLRSVCAALQALAEPRGITMELEFPAQLPSVRDGCVMAAGVAVNELATNSVKHAFDGRDSGKVKVTVSAQAAHMIFITVDDDGLPLDPGVGQPSASRTHGIGLDLARRTIAAQNGLLICPDGDSKLFEIRLPADGGELLN